MGIQYSGVTGKQENCQVGVFLAYVSPHGQTLYDRKLYLPRDWVEDAARRAAADVPADVRFATKPQVAKEVILRALERGLPVAWVTGDEVYGADYRLRVALEEREQPYALTVSAKQASAVGWPPNYNCRTQRARGDLERAAGTAGTVERRAHRSKWRSTAAIR